MPSPAKTLTLSSDAILRPFFAVAVTFLATAILVAVTGTAAGQEKQTNEPEDQSATSIEVGEDGWQYLLNENLDGWLAFTGVPHKSVTIKDFPQSSSIDCRKGKPFGEGDPLNVFQIEMVDGKPELYITGQIYAGLSTDEQFGNYHLSTEFKWGQKKWEPRLKMKRDSGVLIHCTGKQGRFWNVWMRCLECQVQEGDCGDFIQLAGMSCQVRGELNPKYPGFPYHKPDGDWITIGPGVARWGAKRSENHEIKGDWNTIEIHTVGDRTVFSVNGNPVMYLKDTKTGKFSDGKPLTKGHIQIQSEGAEVRYRNMRIKPLAELPPAMAAHFED
jgi:hypothetical protein